MFHYWANALCLVLCRGRHRRHCRLNRIWGIWIECHIGSYKWHIQTDKMFSTRLDRCDNNRKIYLMSQSWVLLIWLKQISTLNISMSLYLCVRALYSRWYLSLATKCLIKCFNWCHHSIIHNSLFCLRQKRKNKNKVKKKVLNEFSVCMHKCVCASKWLSAHVWVLCMWRFVNGSITVLSIVSNGILGYCHVSE